MKKLISFFEIPANNFLRAVKFYENIFNIRMEVLECDSEQMAFFMEEGEEQSVGAISCAAGFLSSERGILIHFNCEDVAATSALVEQNGGKIIIPKTKIIAENRGYFCVFADSEGNHIGLYSDR